ncbi:1-(5-phosphoribosyl)-5-[(5-phosphoribosylamino)methylideneamino] imidazole-4-carboxamide isomerase [Desulfobotulus alkaliphilus]|uniref:1-(5-phosphoribosyl)-5-[(5-phosphoribosylamino)methylideneamino] imidazole-4-carboxamide isomerase n=1 Tax=Desulfobotulus alkaliphilus TaxID=622671 RepID=A0A562RDU6_9BACT|nr:1-(5-phosphoribosyl)-5-[(5-phosphoribosylamino)methylideneamino]imidazole-4-carboxamide isomerase [Desulfobotulus alkaliphilus]TWI67232.1 1-(5-phosphoribosyl)-5-[(5-phosphoribosylamino)methylideneamino] imidazole-4-carboxamide isomerase [Desulfobotulus alkaliphilus]
MILIPAVDIKNGRCVRLFQGRMDAETVFSHDPVAQARQWEAEGALRIHLVDLDGAVEQKPRNLELIEKIASAVGVPVQVGGGIRSMETISHYLSIGVDRVILGTAALRNPELVRAACADWPGRIVVGIDARAGMVAVDGWVETSETTAIELARRFEGAGVAAIIFTDIGRDGTHGGVNLEETKALAEAVSIPVIASGGVSTLKDLEALLPLEASGVEAVISGRALYEGTLTIAEANTLFRSAGFSGGGGRS